MMRDLHQQKSEIDNMSYAQVYIMMKSNREANHKATNAQRKAESMIRTRASMGR